jgi:hypothetical protein
MKIKLTNHIKQIDNLEVKFFWWKYFLTFCGGLTFLFGSIAIANYNLNPLMYSSDSNKTVAKSLSKGQNYQVFNPNLDWRLLKREHIQQMAQTPEVIVFGGSRWQEATSELVKGKTFYNAMVHNDYFEDLVAITQILKETKHLPKVLVLSVRYDTFTPIKERSSDLWLTFLPEYQILAKQLGLSTPDWQDTFSFRSLNSLLSVEGLKQHIKVRMNTSSSPGATKEILSENFDIIRFDGALTWSSKHQQKFTPVTAQKDAQTKVKQDQKRRLNVNPAAITGLGKLLDFLNSQGTRVVLAQTPFHPTYYSSIINTPYGQDLQRIELEVEHLGKTHNVLVVGSFNPLKAGCSASNFIDYHHANQDCLSQIFKQIPGL